METREHKSVEESLVSLSEVSGYFWEECAWRQQFNCTVVVCLYIVWCGMTFHSDQMTLLNSFYSFLIPVCLVHKWKKKEGKLLRGHFIDRGRGQKIGSEEEPKILLAHG